MALLCIILYYSLQKRDFLTRLKQAKDSVRSENSSLKQQGGLVGYHGLLRDFENKQDEVRQRRERRERIRSPLMMKYHFDVPFSFYNRVTG